MNIIKTKVSFQKRTCVITGVNLTTGDYNSTKMVFDFDTDEGRKVLEMINPSGQLVYISDIINNEAILVGKANVTTKHDDVTYIKYLDSQDNVYWYDSENEELYNAEWEQITEFDLDNYTKQTEDCSLFTEEGEYVFEISLYGTNSKLTSASNKLMVLPQQISINDEIVEGYLPYFDALIEQLNAKIEEVDNININQSKSGSILTITITKKDGTTSTANIRDGYDLEYNWSGTSLGIKREDESEYQYVDLKGNKGDTSTIEVGTVATLPAGSNATVENVGTQTDAIFNFGIPQGIRGEQGPQGDDYVITQGDYEEIAGIVETDIEPTITDIQETADTANNTANTAKSIAEGANQALSYVNYSTMITAFNALDDDVYRTGQNVYIQTRDVPDLWVYSVESTSVTYTYTTDAAFVNELTTNGYVQVGYYKLSMLETQKVDLTNYVTNTDYGTTSTGGVSKHNSGYGTVIYNGTMATYPANNSDIDDRTASAYATYSYTANTRRPITPATIDYAVRKCLSANKGSLTNAEKTSSQEFLGFVTLTQAQYDALETKNASTYYFIVEE